MTRRNDKRNNRRNRQRNNTPELPPFAQMLFGAIVGKGVDMIAKKMAEIAEEETPDAFMQKASVIRTLPTSITERQPYLRLRIPADGSAVEYPIPDNLQFFFDEEGKLMVRQKIEGDENPTDAGEGKPITYDDICDKFFLNKRTYWLDNKKIDYIYSDENNYNDLNNCTSMAQAKRVAAFIKLQNIAKFLNGDWKPNFDRDDEKWNINKDGDTFIEMYTRTLNKASVYFKSQELTKEAIRLMGEDSLNDLFSTDW